MSDFLAILEDVRYHEISWKISWKMSWKGHNIPSFSSFCSENRIQFVTVAPLPLISAGGPASHATPSHSWRVKEIFVEAEVPDW